MTIEWNSTTIENKIGIKFKHSELLFLALSHPSYAQQTSEPENDNQRLELLGESILNLGVADYLYTRCPYLAISKLAGLRDKLLEGERLTNLWFQLGLGEAYPLLISKEERYLLRNKRNNPFEKAFKALIGAIHLDRGFSQTANWMIKHLISPLLERHLKAMTERVSPEQQLAFLGNPLLDAIIIDYLYRHLPYVNPERLKGLHKKLLIKEKQVEYWQQLTAEDFALMDSESATFAKKSFKTCVASIYVQYNTSDPKGSFKKTAQWLTQHFINDDEILKEAIALLLKAGKPQKWIIRYVMGYESKDYDQGRERYRELMNL